MSTQLPANNCNVREILEEPEIRTEAEKFLIIIHSKGVGFFSAVTFVSRHFHAPKEQSHFFRFIPIFSSATKLQFCLPNLWKNKNKSIYFIFLLKAAIFSSFSTLRMVFLSK